MIQRIFWPLIILVAIVGGVYVLTHLGSPKEAVQTDTLPQCRELTGEELGAVVGAFLKKQGYDDYGVRNASPVYCSGASWQAFIHVINKLQKSGELQLSEEAVNGLLVNMQPDGTDSWDAGTRMVPALRAFFMN